MKNIAYYIISDGIGGAENVVIQTLNNFKHLDNFYLITNNEISSYFETIIPKEKTLNIGNVYFHTKKKLKYIKYFLNNRFYNFRKLTIKSKSKSILNFCKSNKINIIHCHLDYALYSGLNIKNKISSIKILYTVHGAFGLIDDKRLKPDIPLELIDFTKIDLTVFVAKYLKIIYQKNNIHTGNNTVIYNGVKMPSEFPKRQYNFNTDVLKILFVGGNKYVKGFDLIIELSKLLAQSKTKFEINVLGSVPHESIFYKSIHSCNLQNYFVLHGFIDPPKHLEYFQNNHVLIMPSRSEALPMAAIEAVSLNMPVIASEVGGISEIIINNKNGLLCELEANQFYKRLKDLINNYSTTINEYALFNKFHREQFNLENVSTALINLYNS